MTTFPDHKPSTEEQQKRADAFQKEYVMLCVKHGFEIAVQPMMYIRPLKPEAGK